METYRLSPTSSSTFGGWDEHEESDQSCVPDRKFLAQGRILKSLLHLSRRYRLTSNAEELIRRQEGEHTPAQLD